MKRSALYETHIELGGRMVEFAGWELPVQYPSGPTEEHVAVRQAAGLFDIGHMGQFEVSGPDSIAFIERVQVAAVTEMNVYDARYSLVTYADGTIVDDIFVYRLPNRWLIVVNASNRLKDFTWLQAHTAPYNVELTDVSETTYMLALQGPNAEQILQQTTQIDLQLLGVRKAIQADVMGVRTLIGRTGYTGEDGFELYFPAESAVLMWNELLHAGSDAGLLPCGLAARDSLRFEACMPLYGHEINANTNPIEARLSWSVNFDYAFLGRSAILKSKLEGASKRLVGLEMIDRAVPREGYAIQSDGDTIGHVTTGMRSPTLNKFLAMGYVTAPYSRIGSEVDIVIRGATQRAIVVKRPFYRRS